jgi:hypothetical protein
MSTGMVLDKAFRLYGENFPLMVGISAIFSVPTLLLSLLTVRVFTPGVLDIRALLAVLIGSLGTIIGFVFVYPLTIGATTKAVSERYLGNPVTIGAAMKEAWSSLGTLILNQLVVGVIVAVGFLLLIVPGILWTLSYSMIVPVTILETRRRSLNRPEIRRRSWELVRDNRGKVFAIMFVIIVIQMLLGWGAQLVVNTILGTGSTALILGGVSSNLASIFIYPLQTIAITLLYYDLRIRKEGFDLEMLSHAIGSPSPNVSA